MTLTEALQIIINEEHLEDFIYNIRSSVAESGEKFEGNSWCHPRVVRWAEACNTLKVHLEALERLGLR